MSKLDLEATLEPLNHSREGASEMATAVYPGSFNPPTVAHLAISKAALQQREIDTIVWSVSRVALGKEKVSTPTFEHRIAVRRSWLCGWRRRSQAQSSWLVLLSRSAYRHSHPASDVALYLRGH